MGTDRLFLLKPGFRDGDDGPFYCPGCARVEGVLTLYPRLREVLEVHYLDFPRPRPALVQELGLEHQGAPVLILGDEARAACAGVQIRRHEDRWFVSGSREICNYLAAAWGIDRPHW